MRTIGLFLAIFLVGGACSGAASPSGTVAPLRSPADTAPARATGTPTPTRTPTPTATPPSATADPSASAPHSGAPLVNDGPITPGRYTLAGKRELECEASLLDCPPDATPGPPLEMEITVPAGWQASNHFRVIFPSGEGGIDAAVRGPDGAGLVLGWTNNWVGLNSDPCLPVWHVRPDIPVGPTVDDFVDAVVAHPALEVSDPTDVELGDHRGRLLTLTGPSDISGCLNWRPWDPGFYVQGRDNIWHIWVIDVDGFRVLIVAQYFAGTPADIKADLGEMVQSIRFVP